MRNVKFWSPHNVSYVLTDVTGVNATALGLGRNAEALTFSRCADVGLNGSAGDPPEPAEATGLPSFEEAFFPPLNGGMGCMTILIRGTVFDASIWTEALVLLGSPLLTTLADPMTAELLLETTPAVCCFGKDGGIGALLERPVALTGAMVFWVWLALRIEAEMPIERA